MNNVESRDFLDYLAPQIGADSRNYRDLLSLMFGKEFVWIVPNDDNRIGDALYMRAEWFEKTGVSETFGPCSFLEVLIGVSHRMAFMMDEPAKGWAWQLIVNLGLEQMQDPLGRVRTRKVDEILDAVIWRTYKPDGTGGFFPLSKPHQDQTEIEIWFQMCAYVEEIHPEF